MRRRGEEWLNNRENSREDQMNNGRKRGEEQMKELQHRVK
jgi:hypothetical protein